jgi:hypothetical protein
VNRPIDGLRGRTALVMCHCAGMMDILALPVWGPRLARNQMNF